MKMSFALLCTTLLLLVAMEAAGLSCPPCEEMTCSQATCRGGKVLDICGCCMICAKVEGEACGGQWRNQGRCDTHLACVYRDKSKKGGVGRCEPGKVTVRRLSLAPTVKFEAQNTLIFPRNVWNTVALL